PTLRCPTTRRSSPPPPTTAAPSWPRSSRAGSGRRSAIRKRAQPTGCSCCGTSPAPVVELYPAIDLRGGQAVRLLKGDYAAETVYSDDPVAVARSFETAGARWIHVVDLDAARSGEAGNLEFVAAIARSVGCDVETGGGVRSVEAAERLLDAGVARVVIGTAAVERPELVTELAARYPGRVAVGLD